MNEPEEAAVRRLLTGVAGGASVTDPDLGLLHGRARRRRRTRAAAAAGAVVLVVGAGTALVAQTEVFADRDRQQLVPVAPPVVTTSNEDVTPTQLPVTTEPSTSPPARTVAVCTAAHGLSTPVVRTVVPFSSGSFQSCVLPQGPGAAVDGYTGITYVTHSLQPQRSEATNESEYDVVHGTCTVYELQYRYANMGATDQEPVQRVAAGERVSQGHLSYLGDELVPRPEGGDVVVAHNASYTLTDASCTTLAPTAHSA